MGNRDGDIQVLDVRVYTSLKPSTSLGRVKLLPSGYQLRANVVATYRGRDMKTSQRYGYVRDGSTRTCFEELSPIHVLPRAPEVDEHAFAV